MKHSNTSHKCNKEIVSIFLSFLVLSLPVVNASEIKPILDGNGNLKSGDGFCRTYNELNQLVKVYEGDECVGNPIIEYIWHPTEERVLVKDVYEEGNWKETIYYVDENYVLKENASGEYPEVYIKIDGQLLAQNVNGEKQSLHPDYLGSMSLILDSDGNIVENTWYSPFGEIVEGGKYSRYSYEGKELDKSIKELDFHFRKYKPGWGMFTKPDSIIPNKFDPQQLNRYAFERNNPIKHIDPDGHAFPLALAFVIVGIIGLSMYIKESMDYVGNPNPTTQESTHFYVNSVITAASAGGGKSIVSVVTPTVAGTTVSVFEVDDMITDAIVEVIEEDKEEKVEEEEKKIPKLKKAIYIDEYGNEVNIMIPENAKRLRIYSGGSGGGGTGSNVIERGDGHWVIEGSEDDDGTRPDDNEDDDSNDK